MNEEDDENDDEKNAFLDQIKSEVLIIFLFDSYLEIRWITLAIFLGKKLRNLRKIAKTNFLIKKY